MSSFFTPGQLPDCWLLHNSHRGAGTLILCHQASAKFPENTISSFEVAMREGSHGIESDVHVSADGVVIMFHDPDLSRTTDSTGLIRDRNWFGEKGMEHCRTTKEPRQSIPTFSETIALLMRPENRHVKFNVDVKVQNDPERLFKLMHEIIAAQEDWEKTLAPRILLGLWHSNFILPAKKHLPYLTLSHIGVSLEIAREYFWESCDVFSMVFGSLATIEGERFRKDVEKAGKHIMVWTVNTEQEMMEAARWRVAAILTDKPQVWLDMRSRLSENEAVSSQYPRTFLWTSPFYYRPASLIIGYMARKRLEKAAGPLQKVSISAPPLNPTEPPVIIVATA